MKKAIIFGIDGVLANLSLAMMVLGVTMIVLGVMITPSNSITTWTSNATKYSEVGVPSHVERFENDEAVCYRTYNTLQCNWKIANFK